MPIISGVRYLLDTNVLVYAVNAHATFHTAARMFIEDGLERGALFVVAQQNIVEFISVMTRAYGVESSEVMKDARAFLARFECITPQNTTLDLCMNLSIRSEKRAFYPFDVFLAATMLDNDVDRIITENIKDFQGLGLREIIPLR